MTAPTVEIEGIVLEVLDQEEGRQLLDEQARKYFDMTGDEFSRSYCAGQIDIDDPNGLMVSMLLPIAGIWCDAWTNAD